MSESPARRTDKNTCRKCQRTVIVEVVAGERVETDSELISVVPFGDRVPTKIRARRIHADMCHLYQAQAERKKSLALAKRSPKR